MSPTASERLHTLDDEKLDEIGYPPTKEPKAIEHGTRTVAGPTTSPPPLSMPQPKHAVAPTQRLVHRQPPPALSAPLTVNNPGNNGNNNGNNNSNNNGNHGSRSASTTTASATIESSTTTSSMRTYTTPQPPLSAGSEGDKKTLGNKSVVTTSTGINPKPTPSSSAVSDSSHRATAVRPQSILVRKTGATTNASPSSSSLRKSLSASAMSSSSSSQPPPQEHQKRMQTSLSNSVLQKQHQQQSRAEATPGAAASTSYTKVTFEDPQKRPEVSPEIQAVIEQNNILWEEVNLLRRQQEAWRQSKREMERAKLEMEREQHLVADRLAQLEEQLRHYCLIAAGAGRSEEKGKGVAHPTHSRSDPTTASPRKPPSGGGRSPASKRHRSRSVPRFDEEGEHLSRYPVPQPRQRYDDYDYDYEDYATRPESTDEEEDGWEEYSSRRLPPPPMMRNHHHHHHHHPFPRYPAPPPVVPVAGPSLPPPQLPPLNRKWDGRGGSLRRRRSGSMTPFLPRPVPPHYHTLPPRHHGWRDSGYDAAAADYAWDEPPPPPSYRSSRYYDEPSDDLDDYPAAQKRYPHDRRLSVGRDRRTYPAYGSSM